MNWIPCSERLPDHERVLIYVTDRYPHISVGCCEINCERTALWTDDTEKYDMDNGWPGTCQVTYWMPLPEPPK